MRAYVLNKELEVGPSLLPLKEFEGDNGTMIQKNLRIGFPTFAFCVLCVSHRATSQEYLWTMIRPECLNYQTYKHYHLG